MRHITIDKTLGIIVISGILYVSLRKNMNIYRIKIDKVHISDVKKDFFHDFINIKGEVTPVSTVYLDAIEGGVIEKIYLEEGAMVVKGDVILELGNDDLKLDILNSKAQLVEKNNFLREVRIKMQQQKMEIEKELLKNFFDLKAQKRNYEQTKSLFEEELISKEKFLRAEEAYLLAKASNKIIVERKNQDSLFREIQIRQLESGLSNMEKNFQLVNKRPENLIVKSPVAGQVGMLNAEIGQSVQQGERLGQIHILNSYKIEAEIDEHYMDRVQKKLRAKIIKKNDTIKFRLHKIYPEVRNGKFKVDFVFTDKIPENIRIGQTFFMNLELGAKEEALLLNRGGFYGSTGGQWVFVVDKSGKFAVKREVEFGRQNSDYYEIHKGLAIGEKVIVSSYDIFGNNEKIVFE